MGEQSWDLVDRKDFVTLVLVETENTPSYLKAGVKDVRKLNMRSQ